jgi:hypothetical protein
VFGGDDSELVVHLLSGSCSEPVEHDRDVAENVDARTAPGEFEGDVGDGYDFTGEEKSEKDDVRISTSEVGVGGKDFSGGERDGDTTLVLIDKHVKSARCKHWLRRRTMSGHKALPTSRFSSRPVREDHFERRHDHR